MTISRDRVLALLAALACLAGAGWMWVQRTDEVRLSDARDLLAQHRDPEAVAKAASVAHDPARFEALHTRALALARQNRFGSAASTFRAAAQLEPSDWTLRRDWALTLLRLGDRAAAQAQMSRALALNPRMQLPRGFVK